MNHYLLQTDDHYAAHTMVTILSVQKNTPAGCENHFHIINAMSPGKAEEMRQFAARFGMQLSFIDCTDVIAEMEGMNIPKWRGNYTTYLKLFVLDRIPAVDRILYMDGDIVVRGDLTPAFAALDDSNAPIAMAKDMHLSHIAEYVNYILGAPNATYYNAGVMLFDLPRWRAQEGQKRVIDFILHNQKALRYCEQDIVNTVFKGEIAPLSNIYNFFTPALFYRANTLKKVFRWDDDEVANAAAMREGYVVGHCFGVMQKRPWVKGSKHPLAEEYAALYEEIFGVRFEGEKLPFKNECMSKLQGLLYAVCPPMYHAMFKRVHDSEFTEYAAEEKPSADA